MKIELKNKILEELQKTSTDGSSLLPNLKNLLIRASRASSTNTADQIKSLSSELGRMIPLDALPDEGQGKPLTEIWINYPLTEQDKQVEQYLIDRLLLTGLIKMKLKIKLPAIRLEEIQYLSQFITSQTGY